MRPIAGLKAISKPPNPKGDLIFSFCEQRHAKGGLTYGKQDARPVRKSGAALDSALKALQKTSRVWRLPGAKRKQGIERPMLFQTRFVAGERVTHVRLPTEHNSTSLRNRIGFHDL